MLFTSRYNVYRCQGYFSRSTSIAAGCQSYFEAKQLDCTVGLKLSYSTTLIFSSIGSCFFILIVIIIGLCCTGYGSCCMSMSTICCFHCLCGLCVYDDELNDMSEREGLI
jgi:hypothetical protein